MTEPSNQPPPPPSGYLPPPPGGYPPPPPVGSSDYGAAAPPGMYVDQRSGLILPQGVAVASVGRRIGAWFLAIPLFIVTLGIGYIIWGFFLWPRGSTPVYKVLGLKCWRPADGRPAGFWWMALREIVGRIADGILSILSELVSFVLFVTGAEHKSLHDWIASTVVVHDPQNILG